jgi:hypothetical protein
MKDLGFQKAEYEGTITGVPRITKGWAMKTANIYPACAFFTRSTAGTREAVNQKDPYVQPEEVVVLILGMQAYWNDIFVANMLTAARVKSYFSRLVQQKGKVNISNAGVPLPAAVDASRKYGNLTKRKDLVDLLVRERNIRTTGSLARKTITALVDLLLENDALKKQAENNDMDDGEAHVMSLRHVMPEVLTQLKKKSLSYRNVGVLLLMQLWRLPCP